MMLSERDKQIEAIYHCALEKQTDAERQSYLDSACGSDSELRAAVEGLLKAHDGAGDFLKKPPVAPAVTLDTPPISEGPGTVIGRYKLLELIGEGGFGVVYMADQTTPISRRVALKIIKLGMDTKEVIARFEAERQALAMMEHPNIAQVLDAGATDTGRPYFVMELVKGIPVTEYCDKNNLDMQQRLELFISVCKAIQHAHQKGIIHRDLKPSNVMIALHDGEPVPKVIDFGIAKATGQRLTEKTLFTRYAQMVGTPEYMSPEQAEFSGLDVDTRSDVYSLGVLLYQLLTGVTPFDGEKLRDAGYVEMQRIIREDEPDKPSTKLSTMGEALTDVAKHRKITPDLLQKSLRGDLDWIVMKTLEKDRTRRYETAHELATDIERHLADELVLAGPPSAGYRLRKFVRRNRVATMTGLLIAAALLAVAVVSAMYAREATLHAKESEDARQEISGLLAGSYVDRAQALCEQGEVGRGMLWLADSLKILPEDSSDLDRAVRTSLAGWYGQLHSLKAVVKCPPVEYLPLAGGFTEGPFATYTMTSSGTDIFGTSDQFHFACKKLTGPGSIVARVDSIKYTHDWAKAGVMMRNTLSSASMNASVVVTPERRVAFQCRKADIGITHSTYTDANSVEIPHWVRLTRQGNRFTAQHSSDGSTWEDVRSNDPNEPTFAEIPMSENVCVGLALTSPNVAQICEAVFADVMTTGSVNAEWRHQDIGIDADATGPLSQDQINSVTFSRDGSRILVGYQDGTARLCDGITGRPIGKPLRHGSAVMTVIISPDGKRMATRGADSLVRLWETDTLKPVGEPMPHAGGSQRGRLMAFSSDGSRLITGGTDGAVRLWDASTGKGLGKAFQYESLGRRDVRAMACCAGGFRVVMQIGPHAYQLFDADRGAPIGPPVDTGSSASAVAISPDGRRFATAIFHSLIPVWDAATGRLALEPIVHGGIIYALAFSPDGSRIISGGNTRIALLWDAATGEPIGAPLRQRDTVRAVAFSADGTRVATGNQDGVVRIWDLIHSKYVGEPVKHEDRILAAHYGPDGLRILTETDGAVQVREAVTGRPIGEPLSHPDPVGIDRIAFSPDGSRLLTQVLWTNACLRLWDLATGEQVGEPLHPAAACMALSLDGSRILSGGVDGVVRLWDAATLKCLREFRQHRKVISAVAFSPDGLQFLTGSHNGTTQLWDAATLEPIGKPLAHQSEVKDAAFSPDGSKVLIGYADGTVRLWDAATLKPIGTPLQQVTIVCGVAFSRDGSQLLACSMDRTARLWDAATLKPIGPPLEHSTWWPHASFSPDGSEILLTDYRGAAEVWQAPPGPPEGDYERIACWVQVVTGMELDPTGGINVLDAPAWQQRRQRLQELGGPPGLTLPGL